MQRLKIVFPQIVYDNNTNTNHKNVNPIYHNRKFGKEKKNRERLKMIDEWTLMFYLKNINIRKLSQNICQKVKYTFHINMGFAL